MRKKALLISVIALASVLMASSLIALSQAWWFQTPNYVAYDFKAVFNKGTNTLTDTSGAPYVMIFEGIDDNIVSMNLTIGSKVYYYPCDFTYQDAFHFEFNAITGEGFFRAEATITFNLPGKPTITDAVVSHVTNFPSTPTGSTNNTRYQGAFQITGTKQFAFVNGFGVEDGRYLPGNAGLYTRHFGLIKGWTL